MRSNILTLAIAAVFGLFLTAGDAQACHKKIRCAAPTPACVPAPVCAPVACAAPVKKCHFSLPKLPKMKCFKMPKISLCHKSAPVCEAGPVCGSCESYPSAQSYSAPQSYSSPQSYSTPQILSSGQ